MLLFQLILLQFLPHMPQPNRRRQQHAAAEQQKPFAFRLSLRQGKEVERAELLGLSGKIQYLSLIHIYNFDNVMRFLDLVSHPDGLNLSHRHISLSTCGVVDRIYELADKNLQITLSISLHATENETRSSIMPVNRRWNIGELLTACRYYTDKTQDVYKRQDEKGKIQQKPVTVGINDGTTVEIKEGVNAGDIILYPKQTFNVADMMG